MTEPASYEDGTPKVTLAGKQWPIPLLAPRQLRHMREELFTFNRMLGRKIDGSGDAFVRLTNEQYEALLLRPVWRALTSAHPKMIFEEFEAMPMTETELSAAWFVVRDQSGLFIKAEPAKSKEGGGEDAGQGEARETVETSSPGTGI